MLNDFKSIQDYYRQLKAERSQYESLWRETARYVGITVDPANLNTLTTNKSQQLDQYVDDPTSVISVNQAGDYLMGILWGTGDSAFNVVPSQAVLEKADLETLEPWFDHVSRTTLYQINHPEAGFAASLRPYIYDQVAIGTSGIGLFQNKDYKRGISHNAFLFRSYGVDNTCLDEGKNGLPETVFATYRWTLSRILNEFCTEGGAISEKLMAKMPKVISEAYRLNKWTEAFSLVFGVFPREDFDPKKKGKKGTRYRGVWFLEDQNNNEIFREEDYKTKPIAMARMIKIRGHKYGRSSGTMLLSSIKAVNFMFGTAMEILEKMNDPALGIMNNAIFGDSVLDSSSGSLTVFNPSMSGGQNPIFPLYDVGDPSKLLQFVIPYLNEKITTAFKVDALLDFNSAKDMTATESLQRYAIRGKSLAGMLIQQKNEVFYPLAVRAVTLLSDMGELGVDPMVQSERAMALHAAGRGELIIPQAVLDCMAKGEPWFDIKFNNEMEKLTRTETVEGLLKVLQVVMAIAPAYPAIVEAVDWYKLLSDINSNVDPNNQILIGANAFKEKLAAAAQMQQAMVELQAAQGAANVQNTSAQALKTQREVTSGR